MVLSPGTPPVYGSETSSALSTRGEYVTDSMRNIVNSYDGVASWGETPEEWWKFYATRDWAAGGFAWTGFDYRGEPTPYGWPSINSQFGIVDMCGFPKDYFYYYKAWWKSEPVLHLFPHWNWQGREGIEDRGGGRDGNFILNVGPRPDGEIDPPQVERLRQIGAWLRENGESIYETRGGPWLPGDYGVSTHKRKVVYLHVLKAPKDGTLELPNLPTRIVRMTDMSGKAVSYVQDENRTSIKLLSSVADAIDLIIKVEMAEPWNSNTVVPVEVDRGLSSPKPVLE